MQITLELMPLASDDDLDTIVEVESTPDVESKLYGIAADADDAVCDVLRKGLELMREHCHIDLTGVHLERATNMIGAHLSPSSNVHELFADLPLSERILKVYPARGLSSRAKSKKRAREDETPEQNEARKRARAVPTPQSLVQNAPSTTTGPTQVVAAQRRVTAPQLQLTLVHAHSVSTQARNTPTQPRPSRTSRTSGHSQTRRRSASQLPNAARRPGTTPRPSAAWRPAVTQRQAPAQPAAVSSAFSGWAATYRPVAVPGPSAQTQPPPTSAQRPPRLTQTSMVQSQLANSPSEPSPTPGNLDAFMEEDFPTDADIAAELGEEDFVRDSQAESQSGLPRRRTLRPIDIATNLENLRGQNWNDEQTRQVAEGYSAGWNSARIEDHYQLGRGCSAIRNRKKWILLHQPQLLEALTGLLGTSSPLVVNSSPVANRRTAAADRAASTRNPTAAALATTQQEPIASGPDAALAPSNGELVDASAHAESSATPSVNPSNAAASDTGPLTALLQTNTSAAETESPVVLIQPEVGGTPNSPTATPKATSATPAPRSADADVTSPVEEDLYSLSDSDVKLGPATKIAADSDEIFSLPNGAEQEDSEDEGNYDHDYDMMGAGDSDSESTGVRILPRSVPVPQPGEVLGEVSSEDGEGAGEVSAVLPTVTLPLFSRNVPLARPRRPRTALDLALSDYDSDDEFIVPQIIEAEVSTRDNPPFAQHYRFGGDPVNDPLGCHIFTPRAAPAQPLPQQAQIQEEEEDEADLREFVESQSDVGQSENEQSGEAKLEQEPSEEIASDGVHWEETHSEVKAEEVKAGAVQSDEVQSDDEQAQPEQTQPGTEQPQPGQSEDNETEAAPLVHQLRLQRASPEVVIPVSPAQKRRMSHASQQSRAREHRQQHPRPQQSSQSSRRHRNTTTPAKRPRATRQLSESSDATEEPPTKTEPRIKTEPEPEQSPPPQLYQFSSLDPQRNAFQHLTTQTLSAAAQPLPRSDSATTTTTDRIGKSARRRRNGRARRADWHAQNDVAVAGAGLGPVAETPAASDAGFPDAGLGVVGSSLGGDQLGRKRKRKRDGEGGGALGQDGEDRERHDSKTDVDEVGRGKKHEHGDGESALLERVEPITEQQRGEEQTRRKRKKQKKTQVSVSEEEYVGEETAVIATIGTKRKHSDDASGLAGRDQEAGQAQHEEARLTKKHKKIKKVKKATTVEQSA
ncbi:hypothetical protein LTR53_005709 [Teratosphaeriaceae sp. CCFEE 6253]|nr:hypothetical protein LTR53_005709 [Teratosphaeriaceae sp. CCFEE 6253]